MEDLRCEEHEEMVPAEHALRIYNDFIGDDAALQVNISAPLRHGLSEIFQNIDDGDVEISQDVFDSAQKEVMQLIVRDPFKRLKETAVYKQYWKEKNVEQTVDDFVV